MHKFLHVAAVLALAALPFQVQADLVGDSIDAGIYQFGIRKVGFGLDGPFIVAAGISDQKQYSTSFLLNVEGDKIFIDHGVSTAVSPIPWAFGVELRLLDLDWVGEPGVQITGLVIDTNVPGWTETRASFGPHSVTLNWDALYHDQTSRFEITLLTSPVPEPGIALMLACGLLAVSGAKQGSWKRAQEVARSRP